MIRLQSIPGHSAASRMLAGFLAVAGIATSTMAGAPDDAIDFDRHIRPILSDRCFQCHGPDGGSRFADLRLDLRDEAVAERRNGVGAIVPGDASSSLIMARLTSHDPDVQMPPPDSGKSVSAEEIELLRRWINEGAQWEEHWAWLPPQRPDVPTQHSADWSAHPIDAFIAQKLQAHRMTPSEEADRVTLIRRVTQDLTGLPPTVEEVDAFLTDSEPDAYERLVDRLLDTPQYGEHMTRYWMDAARYGDTHGLHLDNERSMWPWRDWVINAFNSNMPYDQFTIEQLAGDLLPEPTTDQLVATGFNRNHVTTSEGGAIDAEYLVKYASDRVETTSTVWMGLTVGCAACHDHKFDPISQREYYEMFAFFNNTTEAAMDGNRRDPPPIIRVPRDEDHAVLAEIAANIDARVTALQVPNPEVDAAETEWIDDWSALWGSSWEPVTVNELTSSAGTTFEHLDDGSFLATGENPAKDTYTYRARINGAGHQLIRLECLTDPSLPHTGPGRAENANFVLSEIEAEWISSTDGETRPIRFASAVADHEQTNGPYRIINAIDGIVDDTNGWAPEGMNRREKRTAVFVTEEPFGDEGSSEIIIRLRFETKFVQHGIGRTRLTVSPNTDVFNTFARTTGKTWSMAGPFKPEQGQDAFDVAFGPEVDLHNIDLAQTWNDDTLKWIEKPGFLDGTIHNLTGEQCATYLARELFVPTSRAVTFALGSDDSIKIWINGELVHANKVARAAALDQDSVTVELPAGRHQILMKIVNIGGGYAFAFRVAEDDSGTAIVKLADLFDQPRDSWSDEDAERMRQYFRRRHSPEMRALYDELATLRDEQKKTEAAFPLTLVMNERMERRKTNVLFRGEYDQPRDEVEPGVPMFLPEFNDTLPPNRLGFAQWLVSGQHPLTGRVTVNRLWQQCFGHGIVETSEDFGVQGARPTHPELLDWLAIEFVDSGWDVKNMLRLIVTSATYRQSSDVNEAILAKDRRNLYYARGPRFRLDAEQIRDQALATSGLLVEKIGGAPVRPFQPSGLWKAVAYTDSNTNEFRKDMGDAQYRRTLYTYWKRTSPPPNLATFDAPSRETCSVRRPRTNTPLQVLVLMNDPQFVEAARMLAQNVILASDDGLGTKLDASERVHRLFRQILSRSPSAEELDILVELHDAELQRFTNDEESAAALLSVGDAPVDESVPVVDMAALTCVASALYCLDETVTRR